MNNFETFNAFIVISEYVRRRWLHRRASGMNGSKSRIQGINKLTLQIMKLGDAGVQVHPMAIPIPVDCSYVDKFNPFAAANHNDLSI
jgi:hypothetical protein